MTSDPLRGTILAHLDAAGLTQARLIVEGLWPAPAAPAPATTHCNCGHPIEYPHHDCALGGGADATACLHDGCSCRAAAPATTPCPLGEDCPDARKYGHVHPAPATTGATPCKRHGPAFNETCPDCLFGMLVAERARYLAATSESERQHGAYLLAAAALDRIEEATGVRGWDRQPAEIDRLRSEVARERARADEAERERDEARAFKDALLADYELQRRGNDALLQRGVAAEADRDRLRDRVARLENRLARVLARAVVVMKSAGNPTWNRRANPNAPPDGPLCRPRGYVWSGKRYSWRSPARLAVEGQP